MLLGTNTNRRAHSGSAGDGGGQGGREAEGMSDGQGGLSFTGVRQMSCSIRDVSR